MPSTILRFPATQGHELAARLEMPAGKPRAYALFAHCFTCSKDSKGAALHQPGARGARHRGPALRFHRSRPERRRFRRFELFLEHRRHRLRRALSEGEPCGAADPDRPQPRRRGGARGGGADSGRARGGDDWARPSIRVTSSISSGTRTSCSRKAKRRSTSAAVRSTCARSSWKTSSGTTRRRRSARCAKRSSSCIRRRIPSCRSTMPRRSSWRRSIPRASSRSTAPITCSRRSKTPRTLPKCSPRGRRAISNAVENEVVPGVRVVEAGQGKFAQDIYAGRHRLRADEPVSVGGADSGPSPYDLLARGARRVHRDDAAPVCGPQAAPAHARHRRSEARQGPRRRLRGVRDARRQDRPDRPGRDAGRRSRRRAAREAARDRGQVPGAPHAAFGGVGPTTLAENGVAPIS